jgi:hypothetical protein
MKRVSLVLAIACLALPTSALSQQKSLKEQLVGTWALVSFENIAPDGTRRHLFGANPKGAIVFEANGRYVQVQVRPDRPKFKANNRLEGTAEENKAALEGAYAAIGTWSVDEAAKTVIRHIEGSASFPNEEGQDRKYLVALAGDELKITIPSPGAGGKTELLLKRNH